MSLILAIEYLSVVTARSDVTFKNNGGYGELGSVSSKIYKLDRPFYSPFLIEDGEGVTQEGGLNLSSESSDSSQRMVELETRANVAIRDGDLVEAQKQLEKLCEAQPQSALNLARLGGVYLRLHKPDYAHEVLKKALAVNAREPVAVYNMGILLVEEQRLDEAAPFFASERSFTLGQLASWSSAESAVLVDLMGEAEYRRLAQLVLSGGQNPAALAGTVESANRILKSVAMELWQANVARQEEHWAEAHEAMRQAFEVGAVAPSVRQDMLYYAYRAGLDKQPVPELKRLALESGQQYALTIGAMICLEQDKAWQALDLLALGSLRSNETTMITAAAQAKVGHETEALKAWQALDPDIQAKILRKYGEADFMSALQELLSR